MLGQKHWILPNGAQMRTRSKRDTRVYGQLFPKAWLPCGGLPPAADRFPAFLT